MAWTDWIPLIIGGVSAAADYKSAKSPDVPEAMDYRQVLNLLMQNSNSPFGSTTYEEGPNGRITRNMQFSPQVQPAFDRLAYRAANPDQAYQLPPQLQQLQQALMNQRLQRMGITPQAGGGGQSPGNFNQPGWGTTGQGIDETAGQYGQSMGDRMGGNTQQVADQTDSRTSEGGNRSASDAGYTPGLDPWRGINSNPNWMPDWLRQSQPGTEGQQEWADRAPDLGKWVGRGVSGLTGAPLLGTLGELLGNAYRNSVYDNYYFQSDNPQGHNPNPLDAFNNSIVNDPRNMEIEGRSPMEQGRSMAGSSWGPWRQEINNAGDLVWVFNRRG